VYVGASKKPVPNTCVPFCLRPRQFRALGNIRRTAGPGFITGCAEFEPSASAYAPPPNFFRKSRSPAGFRARFLARKAMQQSDRLTLRLCVVRPEILKPLQATLKAVQVPLNLSAEQNANLFTSWDLRKWARKTITNLSS
jgi:hypothetical protein